MEAGSLPRNVYLSLYCDFCLILSGILLLSDGSQENGASLQSFRRLLLSR